MDDLGTRLMKVGLLTRSALAVASTRVRDGEALVPALVAAGVDEGALAGFFVAEGHGPQATDHDLASADPVLLHTITASLAKKLLALPLRRTPGGVLVAMADPTDRDALKALDVALGTVAVGTAVLPIAARLGELRFALEVTGTRASAPPPKDDEGGSEPAIHLVRLRESVPMEAPRASPPSDPPMPLVRAKVPPRTTEPPRERTKSYDANALSSFPPREHKEASPRAADGGARGLPDKAQRSDSQRPSVDRWSSVARLPARREPALPAPLAQIPSAQVLTKLAPPLHAPAATDIGPLLGAITTSRDRDQVARLTCEGAVTVADGAVLLVVKKDTLQGWEGVGPLLSRDALRALHIPLSSPSILRKVVVDGAIHDGPYGPDAADVVLRAATGLKGQILAVPVSIGTKVVAVLCAAEVRFARLGRDRVQALAESAAEAFARILKSSR